MDESVLMTLGLIGWILTRLAKMRIEEELVQEMLFVKSEDHFQNWMQMQHKFRITILRCVQEKRGM